jgi:gliding motility-associated-like protein
MAYGMGVVEFNMYIFDRWGELIFEANDINQGWDGTYMGNACPMAVFVYMIVYKEYDTFELKQHTIYGNVNLIR